MARADGTTCALEINFEERWLHGLIVFPRWIAQHPKRTVCHQNEHLDAMRKYRDEAIDLEYLADNLWFVGSPQTVANRIMDLHQQTGGFGRLLIVSYDATDEPESWDRSLRLLMAEVLPRCQTSNHLVPRTTPEGVLP